MGDYLYWPSYPRQTLYDNGCKICQGTFFSLQILDGSVQSSAGFVVECFWACNLDIADKNGSVKLNNLIFILVTEIILITIDGYKQWNWDNKIWTNGMLYSVCDSTCV